jgi:hypothetical protein
LTGDGADGAVALDELIILQFTASKDDKSIDGNGT